MRKISALQIKAKRFGDFGHSFLPWLKLKKQFYKKFYDSGDETRKQYWKNIRDNFSGFKSICCLLTEEKCS